VLCSDFGQEIKSLSSWKLVAFVIDKEPVVSLSECSI
jgi:hypothetical protein